ncbi:hypothetical protein [Paraliomyxa miuraensis]|uniref:hypothetical protein n=1 Tax=Paraliomyxa miuraensis TaxID=376150 RepID=UPI0022525F1E|nr:hypothetical protein [Paraliomyxa miuraensis]MCX4245299.1 hypothetical protein [Paraliomyxa miuraensis]
MSRWLTAMLMLLVVGLVARGAHAIPVPPPSERAEWIWQAVPVHHGVAPDDVRAEAPFVPAGTPSRTGPVEVAPGKAVVVWMRGFATVRVRKPRAGTSGTLRFGRVEPATGSAHARVDVPGERKGEGSWLLHNPVGWGAPWVIESDHATTIVVEQAVARRGSRIWEYVHDATIAWIEGEGSLPRLPAVPGSERYLRRRIADHQIGEALARLPGYDEDVERALVAWRSHRASLELETLRPLSQLQSVQPSGATPLWLPHVTDDPDQPPAPGEPGSLVRLSAPWSFVVRGPSVLRLGVRALFPPEGPATEPISLVVLGHDDDGRERVVARLDTIATPLRTTDPAQRDVPIPTLVDAVASTGQRVSKEYVLAVPLRPGRHRYRVETRGGDVGLTARLGRVLPRALGADAPHTRARALRRARTALEDHSSPAASVMRALLSDPWMGPDELPQALERVPRVRALLELEQLAHSDASAVERASRADRIAAALPDAGQRDPLDTELRMEVFEQLMAAEQPRAAVEVLRPQAQWLNGDELPALVDAVEDPSALWPLEGALDAVATRAPLTARLRSAHVRLWTWTQWSRLRPSTDVSPWMWIETAPPGPPTSSPTEPGTLWSMPLRTTVQLRAEPHPFEAGRTPVLRMLLYAREAIDGMIVLEVDGQRWSAPMQGTSDVFEVAVPTGVHSVRLEAPAGVQAFSTLHPAPGTDAPMRTTPLRTVMWPDRSEGHPVSFELGALSRDTLAQLDLRVVGVPERPSRAAPIEVWIHFDDGSRHRVWLDPGPAAHGLLTMRAPSTHSSDRARVVVPVSAKATRLWVVPTGGAAVAVSAKLRRWETPEAATVLPVRPSTEAGAASDGRGSTSASAPSLRARSVPSGEDAYERLAASTRSLADEPHSASLRLEHAHRLLDVGDVRRARGELVRMLETRPLSPSDPLVLPVRALQARIDAYLGDDFVEVGPGFTGRPIVLQPAVAALAPSDPLRAEVLAADVAAHEGRLAEAFEAHARIYTRTHALATGYAAALALAAALPRTADEPVDPALEPLQPLAFGITASVREQLDTPVLRRLHYHVASSSEWNPLRLAERSAGTRDRGEERARHEPTPSERLHWALLAPPWSPTEARVLRAGTQVVVRLEHPEPQTLDLEAFCDDSERRPSAPDPDPDPDPDQGLAPLRVRVGEAKGPTTTHALVPSPRTVTRLRLPASEGSLRLEVSLPAGHQEQRCALRWTVIEPTEPPPAPERPMRWLLARPNSPVESIVLGPTTLEVTLAPEREGTAAPATVTLGGLDGTDARVVSVPTNGEPALVLVPEPGPRRVVVDAATGGVLVRLSLRRGSTTAPAPDEGEAEDEAEAARRRPASRLSLGPAFERARILWPSGLAATPWEHVGEPYLERVSPLGSWQTALAFSRTDIAEADDPRPRNQLRGSVLWRRELAPSHVWIKLAGHGQGRDGAGAAGGAAATLYAQRGPRRLRGMASVSAWSERYAGAPAWSLHATLRIDRPMAIRPALVLVPFVRADYIHQSLDEPDYAPDAEPSHPQVYSPYLEDHPLALTPGARLRWFPFQDLQLAGEVSTTPNANMATIDHLDASLDLQGIVDTRRPLLVRYGGSYGGSLRLADEDRSRTFLRHGPSLNAGLTYLFPAIGRLNLDVRDTLYLSRPFAVRNGFDIVLSFELTLGRGIRDTAPMELLFRPLYRTQWWRPPVEEGAP